MTKINLFKNSKDFQFYEAGQAIFEEGQCDVQMYMYVINEGEIEISANGDVIDRLGEGDIFGEMALVDNSPRSAKAVAYTDCKVVPVDQKRFEFMVHNHPHFATQVVTIMSRRLRHHMAD